MDKTLVKVARELLPLVEQVGSVILKAAGIPRVTSTDGSGGIAVGEHSSSGAGGVAVGRRVHASAGMVVIDVDWLRDVVKRDDQERKLQRMVGMG